MDELITTFQFHSGISSLGVCHEQFVVSKQMSEGGR
jgi:hypothetical protein